MPARRSLAAWARLMVHGEVEPFPERKYATGIAFLRGQDFKVSLAFKNFRD